MKSYIAYYRVSTQRQGESGLGLSAQKESVMRVIGRTGFVTDEYQDIETGKSATRPNLLKAIEKCKETGSTLIIAKLDRLARNAKFIFTLKDSGVKFVCADMPEANNLTIGILAVIAEDEAVKISTRTREALNQIKINLDKNGVHVSKSGNTIKTLGSPKNLTNEARMKGANVMKERYKNDLSNIRATAFIRALRESNPKMSFAAIAGELNSSGFKTVKGCNFNAIQVQRLFNKI